MKSIMKAMNEKEIIFVIFSLICFSVYSQVSKQELFEAVRIFEDDSLYMPTESAAEFHSLRSAFKYSIWWDDVFFVDRTNETSTFIYGYEMWSSLDRRGKVVEMEGITDETGKEKVRDLISQWNIPKLINLFKRDKDWAYHSLSAPVLYIIKVEIRGGKIVSVNGLSLRGYHTHSKFSCLNKRIMLRNQK